MRYYVATVHGIFTVTSRTDGCSAHVLDSLDLHRVVATFRSEERCKGVPLGGGHRLGAKGAISAARAVARRLNRDEGGEA